MPLRILAAAALAAAALPRLAAADPCAALDAAFPDPGRLGKSGENAFRPLPVLAPMRAMPGAPGTLSAAIAADHVSTAPAGKPEFLWVGNYQVTNIPVFRTAAGPATSFTVTRPEDGLTLPMPDACIASPEWGYAGTEWALVQGDTLDVTLRSRLDYAGAGAIQNPQNGAVPCQAISLHTHGLLISPYHGSRPGQGPIGDYIYDYTAPPHDLGPGNTDSCGTVLGDMHGHNHLATHLPLHYLDAIPGHPGVNSLKSGEHPSGLFWFHAHPHGYAKPETNGGTTGVITVGALTDYACPTGDGTPGHCKITDANIRVMNLKEAQLQSIGLGGQWQLVTHSESGFCTASGRGSIRHGECQGSDSGHVGGKWVFTINGVQYPTIRPGAGKTEIWRIANTSANMTYALSLVGDGPDHGHALPFQLLARDGVSIGQPLGKATTTEVLMFPATRVEIAIPAPPGGGRYVLHNHGIGTGDNGSGDFWPDMDLAEVVWDAGGPAAQAPTEVAVTSPEAAAPQEATDQNAVPARCRFAPGDTRVIYFVHRFVPITTSTTPKEVFGLLAGIRHADGSLDFFNDTNPDQTLHSAHDVWLAGTGGTDQDFPAFGHNPWSSVCTVQGSVEPWELQNWTGEDHNFHPHQSRFAYNPAGNFAYPKFEKSDPAPLTEGDRLVRAYLDPNLPMYGDTIPVPRGQSFCAENPNLPGCQKTGPNDNLECTGEPDAVRCANPGKTSVIMDFSRKEQVGSFVYHCHILEHEDGGMMAAITVLCPPGDAACALRQAQAPICRAGD